jgi:hypothetical protein
LPDTSNRLLTLKFKRNEFETGQEILDELSRFCVRTEQYKICTTDEFVEITIEILVDKAKMRDLSDYLYLHPKVQGFTL